MKKIMILALLVASMGIANAQIQNTYELPIADSIGDRQLLSEWDETWLPEYKHDGFEWQVAGQARVISAYYGDGNPNVGSGYKDYSSFTVQGPPAGWPVLVKMKFQFNFDGAWVSTSHGASWDDDSGFGTQFPGRQHYECALQDGALRVYKVWESGHATIAQTSYSVRVLDYYWLHMTETRPGNDPAADPTILCELYDQYDFALKASVAVTDTDGTAGQSTIPSSRKRGFGAYFDPFQNSRVYVSAWSVEPAGDVEPPPPPPLPPELTVEYDVGFYRFEVTSNWDTDIQVRWRYKRQPWNGWVAYTGPHPIEYQGRGRYKMQARARNPEYVKGSTPKWIKDKIWVKLQ
jgi:hypothetical protein